MSAQGKKKSKTIETPPPPPPPPPPPVLETVPNPPNESKFEEDEAVGIVSYVLDEFISNLIYSPGLGINKQQIPYSVTWVMDVIVQAIEFMHPMSDKVKGVNISALQEDTEPPHSIPDSWAEGCVPVNKVPGPYRKQTFDFYKRSLDVRELRKTSIQRELREDKK